MKSVQFRCIRIRDDRIAGLSIDGRIEIVDEVVDEYLLTPDKPEIEALIGELDQAHLDHDDDASARADLKFHGAVVNASHNAMLIHMMTSIYDLTRRGLFYNRKYLRAVDGTGDMLLDQHHRIAEAVLAGDPDRAEAAAREHLTFVETSFREGTARERREDFAQKRRIASSLP